MARGGMRVAFDGEAFCLVLLVSYMPLVIVLSSGRQARLPTSRAHKHSAAQGVETSRTSTTLQPCCPHVDAQTRRPPSLPSASAGPSNRIDRCATPAAAREHQTWT